MKCVTVVKKNENGPAEVGCLVTRRWRVGDASPGAGKMTNSGDLLFWSFCFSFSSRYLSEGLSCFWTSAPLPLLHPCPRASPIVPLPSPWAVWRSPIDSEFYRIVSGFAPPAGPAPEQREDEPEIPRCTRQNLPKMLPSMYP